jgi:hypothetical protein
VRGWFHYVAWMIRPDLDVEAVRPILLQNLADKLGFVALSTGLLAALHDNKGMLDAFADAFDAGIFQEQYRDRLRQTRESQWNSFPLNLWLTEVRSRELIWDAARSLTV